MKRFLLTMMVGLFAVSCENAFVEEAQFIPVAGKWAKVGEDGLVSRYIEFENGLYSEYNARPLVAYIDGTLWGCSGTYFECVTQQQYSIIDGSLIVEGRNNSNISLTSPTTLKINNIHYDKVTSFNDEYYRQIDVEDYITIDYSTESVAIPCEISNADNDIEIDIECDANWVKSVTYQKGELFVRCSQNSSALKRTAVVTLSYAGAETKNISIVQARNIVSPDNAILYTTSDNKRITTIYASEFGATITSHTYEDGVGIIAFDGPITTIGDEAFRGCSSLQSVTIPDSVTTIGYYAFYDCSSLQSVTIPDSVTTIRDYAFRGCSSLTSITIPDSVTTIGYYAFGVCSSLTSITLPDSVTSIVDGAFYDCSSLQSVTIPDSVTTIGYYAFYDCSSLTSITIPDSVISIGDDAFRGCSSLTSVYCKPTTPPSIEFYTFYSNASGRKIYVPHVSVDKYKLADGWSGYASAIVGYDF